MGGHGQNDHQSAIIMKCGPQSNEQRKYEGKK